MKNIEITNPTPHNILADFLRVNPNLSHTELSNGSKNPRAEVIPANNIARKNRGPNILPAIPIVLNIVGNTINTRPVPCLIRLSIGTPDVTDMKPSMEKTPNAVNISKPEFESVKMQQAICLHQKALTSQESAVFQFPNYGQAMSGKILQ